MATYKVLRPIHLGASRVLGVGQTIELDSETGVYKGRVELVKQEVKPALEVATPKRGRRKKEKE